MTQSHPAGPGPRSRAVLELLRRHESRNVTFQSGAFPVVWQRAEGWRVWDLDGREYLDLTSGFGVAGLGWGHPAVHAALTGQAALLWHGMGDVHPTAAKAELCALLSELTFEAWGMGPGRVLLGNSGFEAVEAALKTAHLATGRRGVVAFTGSYHGMGYGALDVTHRAEFRDPFRAQLPGFTRFLPYPGRDAERAPLERELEALLALGEAGAVLVEPVQGRGGEVYPPDWFLPMLRAACDRHGMVLVFDEIYCGFHRTGPRFACEATAARPDLICLAKAMSAGFPISACVGRVPLMDAWPESTGEALHTSTHLGNPLGCAMAVAALRAWRDGDWAAQSERIGRVLGETLRAWASRDGGVADVRGRGALWGVEFRDAGGRPDGARVARLMEQSLAEGVLVLGAGPDGNVLSVCPPLVMPDAALRDSVACLERVG